MTPAATRPAATPKNLRRSSTRCFFPFMAKSNMAGSPLCFDIGTLSVTLNYVHRMTLGNYFSGNGIGVRLRAGQGSKGFHDVVFQETVWWRRRGCGGAETGEIGGAQGLHH